MITRAALLCAPRPTSSQVSFLALRSFDAIPTLFSLARRHVGESLAAFEFLDAASLALVLHHIEVSTLVPKGLDPGDLPWNLRWESVHGRSLPLFPAPKEEARDSPGDASCGSHARLLLLPLPQDTRHPVPASEASQFVLVESSGCNERHDREKASSAGAVGGGGLGSR